LPRPEVIHGSVDDLNRPFVKLSIAGFPAPVTAFIDTGFNESLIIDEYQAQRMGLEITSQHYVNALLASQRSEVFSLSRGRISWLGEEPFISPLVILETEQERLARRRSKKEEEVVLGVELLLNCKLDIDFAARSVLIARLG
jgi:predicted aspartyl protease